MFRNPVMVCGYPILATSRGLGLEMPLNIIAGLNGSDRVTEFDGKVFIKGYSTMVVATKVSPDANVLTWHYLYNSKGERLSYLDHALENVDQINLDQLKSARHVVGWCDDSMYNAENVTLSAGSIITGSVQFAVGVKDTALHLTRSGYIPKLRWIATKYVLLWDEADKRGWLVNCIRRQVSSAFLLDFGKMQNPSKRTPTSAVEFLINERNRGLEIYGGRNEVFEEKEVKRTSAQTRFEVTSSLKKKKGYTLHEDLVEQQYNILEQIMEHQKRAAGKDGASLRMRARKHLEGHMGLCRARDRPRPIPARGHPSSPRLRLGGLCALHWRRCAFWTGLRRDTPAGEFRGMCPAWKTLPTHKYYMCGERP
ncbi:hypothetical protein B0T22DRAFT_537089 [Podospora appendiculata]|uniref:Uncharacterized protein n=1 Tax=Podospora appendiculata TaxID=314037 RepID=A0AAE0XDN0_9PEZI|nr:hypothetical protein B0T22DRAFT_537089 [Podospora appendiculata]